MTNEIDSKILKIREIVNESKTSDIDKYKQITMTLFQRSRRNVVEAWHKNWMTELKQQDYSYEDIAKLTGLTLSSVRYFLIEGERDKVLKTGIKFRERMKANPVAWKAYVDYQREYQRMLNRKRKALELKSINEKSLKEGFAQELIDTAESKNYANANLININDNENETK